MIDKKKLKKIVIYIAVALLIILWLVITNAQSSRSSQSNFYEPSYQQFYSSVQAKYPETKFTDYRSFFPSLADADRCEARSDFVLVIPPGGCNPPVVRSDLLEEQNVPVFCQVDAIKLNPFVDVSWIKSVSFQGVYPKEVEGVSWHPSKAALKFYSNVLESPILNNVGYVVVLLKKQPNEKQMPNSVKLNITANLIYDLNNAFGTGRASFYAPVLNDKEWQQDYRAYSFWQGRGYLRVDWIKDNSASISLYRSPEGDFGQGSGRVGNVVLQQGQISGDLYLPGFYCSAAVNIQLDSVTKPAKMAKLVVDENSELWLREGEKLLDDNCRVIKIDSINEGGEVLVNCLGKRISLKLGVSKSVSVVKDGKNLGSVSVGEKIPGTEDYLLFSGTGPVGINESEQGRLFIVLAGGIGSAYKKNSFELQDKYLDDLKLGIQNIKSYTGKNDYLKKINESARSIFQTQNAKVIFFGQADSYSFNLTQGGNKEYDKKTEDYYSNTKDEAKNLARFYQGVKGNVGEQETVFSEASNSQLIKLARDMGKTKDVQTLGEEFIKNYPQSNETKEIQSIVESSKVHDFSDSTDLFEVGNTFHRIRLDNIKEPNFNDASVSLIVNGEPKKMGINDYINSNSTNETALLMLKDLEDDYAIFIHSYRDKEGRSTEKEERIKIKERKQLVGFDIFVEDINLRKVAVVKLIPRIPNAPANTTLSAQIGIEKRNIKLSDDKTLEMIENLNKSIKKFDTIVNNLGKVVTGWKAACFATSGFMIAKNFFTGLGGGVQARKAVNSKWYATCDKEAGGDRVSFDACLNKNSAEIEKEISEYKDSVQKVNDRLNKIQDATANKELGTVNTEQATKQYRDELLKDYSTQLKARFGNNYVDYVNHATLSELRDLERDLLLSQQSDVQDLGLKGISNINKTLKERYETNKSYTELQQLTHGLQPTSISFRDDVYTSYYGGEWSKELNDSFKGGNINSADKVQFITIGSENYIAVLDPRGSSAGDYGARDWYQVTKDSSNNNVLVKKDLNTLKEPERSKFKGIIFHRADSASLNNVWKSPRVIYHDSGAFKGLPAIVPLGSEWGRDKGWYAATKNFDIGRANEPTAFTEAAIPKNYYICNVGGNGVQEFESGIGDDLCQFINKDATLPSRILGLSEVESKKLITLADQSLYEASVRYKTALQSRAISLGGANFPVDIQSIAQGPRCQDFMSPEDCKILFNACDPVLCPVSRCDLGGAYPVSNVIQTGIVGGAVLCLPNFREGIVAPVCLTGIHAGLDAYTQILKATQQCLQESLNTGKSVGICDEIKSVYTCEFFWRQIAPFTKIALPKLVELATGKGYRGGQEYATFADSWKQTDNTIGYIRDQYAVDAYRAFLLRSTEEAGTEVCKAFVSTRYPVDKKSLKNFVEPDSPVQFHAKFDEILFTEATVPPTSQYKVYFFIYAGKDEGAYYSVYLKSPPQTGFFAQSQIQPVICNGGGGGTGFVAKGKFVDQTCDFTAPSGYKELCVRINGKDECGFKSVSTSFAVNFIKDEVAKEQAEQEVKTEEECVSGKPSVGALINPNIQEGLQEAIDPQIYKRGIIRICASRNPGESVDPRVGTEAARWKQVGFCGTEQIKCWLDTESVKTAIRNKNIENETLGDIQSLQSKILGDKVDEKETIQSLSDLRTKWEKEQKTLNASSIPSLESKEFKDSEIGKIIARAIDIENRAPLDRYQAQAVFLRFTVYKDIAQILFDAYKKSNPVSQDNQKVTSDKVQELKVGVSTGTETKTTELSQEEKCNLQSMTVNDLSALTTNADNAPLIANPRILKVSGSSDCEGISVLIKTYDNNGNGVDSDTKRFEKSGDAVSFTSIFSIPWNIGDTYHVAVYCPADTSNRKCSGTDPDGSWIGYFKITSPPIESVKSIAFTIDNKEVSSGKLNQKVIVMIDHTCISLKYNGLIFLDNHGKTTTFSGTLARGVTSFQLQEGDIGTYSISAYCASNDKNKVYSKSFVLS